ncbi:MAG TPA: mycofactocin biosynthesis glycosyltransferase MftF [Streptosporangiaceae bacterium]|nr:mycofactocin biosynthesis glycosyltransferase MftF [Streptosporangiaceae bacterium]
MTAVRPLGGRVAAHRDPPVAELPPVPRGFAIDLDADTRRLSDGTLFGGSPARAMRLTAAGSRALAELLDGPVRSTAAGILARRLTDAGLAHPVRPAVDPARPAALSVTVVIPVRDRAAMLDRCLAAVGRDHPVVVVDDGSADQRSVAAVADRHGALLCRRDRSGGPAAARNTGLAGVRTELLAFLDSDCVPPPGWVGALAGHFADPLVGAVAPRIVAASPAARPSKAASYAAARGSLDLGSRPARVLPGGRVSYVPTAALLVRRTALAAVAAGRDVFDPALRYGEDVDLVWRLHRAGWRIRYEPGIQVAHESPVGWIGLLARRFSYGSSAGPLARRHPANMAPLVLQPWPAAAVTALLARRPVLALAAAVGGWLHLAGLVRRAGIPADGAPAATLTAVTQTWLGIGRYATQFAAPSLAVLLAAPGGTSAARRWGRRAAAASLLLGPALTGYAQRRPRLDPVTFTLAHIADDVCYGAGVWAGCARARTLVPVTPVVSWRPLRLPGGRCEPGPVERVDPDG